MTQTSSTKHLIIGTAGHVDHGKTTLIKALTGIDTDRLKEEKERGMTIDLGFAFLQLPSGRKAGIVDVPGHERFLKNMLAGATGVDMVLLVVAADEGIMPQTWEHLNILRLLEAGKGAVALTKVDMVDEDWLEIVEDDLRSHLKGTFLENAPIVRVSATEGKGVRELLEILDDITAEVDERSSTGPFRLPVDRVFSVTGFGTVVTGTLASGTMRVGDAVNILPKRTETRIRGLQVHGDKLQEVQAGNRVAVNLGGVDTLDLGRGDILVPPGYLQPSIRIDALVRLLPDAPGAIPNRYRVRMHIGTSEILGRLVFLETDELQPGQETFVQFRAETPVVAARGDRFVIRSYSPMHTIGGGIVLDPAPAKHKRFDQQVAESLKTKLSGDPRDLVESALVGAPGAITVKDLAKVTGLPAEAVKNELESGSIPIVHLDTERIMHTLVYQSLSARIISSLEDYHEKLPLKAGMPREELRLQVAKNTDAKVFGNILSSLENESKIATSDKYVKLPDFRIELGEKEALIAGQIEQKYRDGGLLTPTADEAISGVTADAKSARHVFELLVDQGKLVKIDESLYIHQENIEQAEKALRDYLAKAGRITVSEFRDLTGTSRKYALPLLGYFDTKRVTRRFGDDRVLFGR